LIVNLCWLTELSIMLSERSTMKAVATREYCCGVVAVDNANVAVSVPEFAAGTTTQAVSPLQLSPPYEVRHGSGFELPDPPARGVFVELNNTPNSTTPPGGRLL